MWRSATTQSGFLDKKPASISIYLNPRRLVFSIVVVLAVGKKGASMVVNLEHPSNGVSETAVRFSGNCIEFNKTHLPNVLVPTEVIIGGNLTEMSDERLLMARSHMLVMVDVSVIDDDNE